MPDDTSTATRVGAPIADHNVGTVLGIGLLPDPTARHDRRMTALSTPAVRAAAAAARQQTRPASGMPATRR